MHIRRKSFMLFLELDEPFPKNSSTGGALRRKAMSDRGSSFGAFLLGGLIGGAIGLLYAPRSGRETRQILVGEGEEMMDRAVITIREAQDKALAAIRETQTRLETLNVEAKDRISKLQEIAESTFDEQKQSLKKGYSEAKKVVQDIEEPQPTTRARTTTTSQN
jgi:gas vesicle protein